MKKKLRANRNYRMLIVDDQPNEVKELMDLLEPKKQRIEVTYTTELEEAKSVIKRNHFHLALVDVNLDRGGGAGYRNSDGIKILAYLRDHKPSCYKVLISEYLTEYRREVFDSLSSLHKTAEEVLDKRAAPNVIIQQIKNLKISKLLINLDLNINYKKDVVRRLKEKMELPKVTLKLLELELEYLFHRLFSDYVCSNSRFVKNFIVDTVTCEEMTEGRSRCVVLKVTPGKEKHEYNRVVMKVGSVDDIRNERDNYIRWIKWLKEYNNRTEFLGYAEADNIAGLLYSFAGGSKAEHCSLAAVLEGRAKVKGEPLKWNYEEYSKLIGDLFNPDKKEFYSDAWITEQKSMKDFFYDFYFPKGVEVYERAFEQWASNREDVQIQLGASQIRVGDKGRHHNPWKYLVGLKTLRKYYQCISHGDLIARNIMVDKLGKYVVIDFARTGLGPLELDFVAMEASVKLHLMKSDRIDYMKFESNLVKKGFEDIAMECEKHMKDRELLAFRLSGLIRNLYKKNFDKKNFEPYWDQERYYLSCMFAALRLIVIKELNDSQKLAMLCWAIQCNKAMSVQ